MMEQARTQRHRRYRRRTQAEQQALTDRLVALDSYLESSLPPFLRQALQRERRRLRIAAQEGGPQA
jgi:hypothetical protein